MPSNQPSNRQSDTWRLRVFRLALLTGLLATVCAHAGEALPTDVRAYVARREQCEHWAGEEPYDRARAARITAAARRLRCEALDDDAQRLRQRYAAQTPVLRALDGRAD